MEKEKIPIFGLLIAGAFIVLVLVISVINNTPSEFTTCKYSGVLIDAEMSTTEASTLVMFNNDKIMSFYTHYGKEFYMFCSNNIGENITIEYRTREKFNGFTNFPITYYKTR